MAKHPAEVFGHPVWINTDEAQKARDNYWCPYELRQTRIESSTIDNLFNAFRNNPNIPSKDKFIDRLQGKIQKNAQIQLDFL